MRKIWRSIKDILSYCFMYILVEISPFLAIVIATALDWKALKERLNKKQG